MCAKKIADAGQELRANRRRVSPMISAEEFSGMNPTLRKRYAQKIMLWPRTDYVLAVQKGMNRVKARFLKAIYESIPAQPHNEDQVIAYVKAVHQLRGNMESWLAKDPTNEIRRIGELVTGKTTLTPSQYAEFISLSDLIKVEIHDLLPGEDCVTSIMQTNYFGYGNEKEIGVDHFWNIDLPGASEDENKQKKMMGGLGKEFFKSRRDNEFKNLVRAIGQDIFRGWPKRTPHWYKYGFRVISKDDIQITKPLKKQYESELLSDEFLYGIQFGDEGYQYFETKEQIDNLLSSTGKWVVLREGGYLREKFFDTEQDALIYVRKESKKKKSEMMWEPESLTEKEIRDSGLGEIGFSKSSEDVQKELNLRGLNFGNWVSNKERLFHLEGIYQSFIDLSSIFGSPVNWLSCGGLLGIAVGAQGGIGSNNAAAHFIAGLDEVNLTKRQGAGSVAHEIGHFLDHLCSRKLGEATVRREFLSTRLMIPKGDSEKKFVRGKYIPKTQDDLPAIITINNKNLDGIELSMANVMNSMTMITEKETDFHMRMEKNLERTRLELIDRKKELGKLCDEETFLLVVSVVDFVVKNGVTCRENERGFELSKNHIHYVPNIGDMISYVDLMICNIDYSATGIRDCCYAVNNYMKGGKAYEAGQETGPTNYLKNSRTMDGHSEVGRYWTAPHEMFARAFSDYVYFKLANQGKKNLYLARDNLSGYKAAMQARKVPAVPHIEGEELIVMSAAMDTLVKDMVKFLSQGCDSYPSNKPMETDEYEKIAA